MDVVVVESRKQGAAVGVDRGLPGAQPEALRDRLDAPCRDAHVADLAFDRCAPDQHRMPSSARRAAVSAPRGGAGPGGKRCARRRDRGARAAGDDVEAEAVRLDARGVASGAEGEAMGHDVAQRELEERPFARAQVGERRQRRMQACERIGDRVAAERRGRSGSPVAAASPAAAEASSP